MKLEQTFLEMTDSIGAVGKMRFAVKIKIEIRPVFFFFIVICILCFMIFHLFAQPCLCGRVFLNPSSDGIHCIRLPRGTPGTSSVQMQLGMSDTL